jgi:hypothetical protein
LVQFFKIKPWRHITKEKEEMCAEGSPTPEHEPLGIGIG